MRLGARLKAARKAAGFATSKAFLKKHQVPASTYSQHESSKRTPDDKTLLFYSKVFEVNFDWLKFGKGLPFKKQTVSKKNLLDEELFDLSELKKIQSESLLSIDQQLLMKMMKEVIVLHQPIQLTKSLISMISDMILLYTSMQRNRQGKILLRSIKQALDTYKNKKD